MSEDRRVSEAPLHVRARVRHEPDCSYAVLVEGPEGEVVVGTTRRTGEVLAVGREGAARVFAVAVGQIAQDFDVAFPAAAVRARWAVGAHHRGGGSQRGRGAGGAGGCGAGALVRRGVGVVRDGARVRHGHLPRELLDFEPVISAEEEAALQVYTSGGADPS